MAIEAEDSPTDESVPERAYRTVTPPYWGRSDTEMNLIGYLLLGGLLILLVPLAPFILAVWMASKILDALTQRGDTE